MIRYGVGAIAALMITGAAPAAELSPIDIVNRHIAAVARSDVQAMMADYADDAVVLQATQARQGKAVIRALLNRMFPRPVPGAPPTGTAAMKIIRTWQDGDVGFFNWQLGSVSGTDEFLVRHGKIEVQAVFLGTAPQTPPR
ncbi:MAG: nuclear transport factor 2 family protein [Janthinobacterium lividum]